MNNSNIVSITTLKNRIKDLTDYQTAIYLIEYCNSIDLQEGKNKRSSENWAANKTTKIVRFRLTNSERNELDEMFNL